MPFCCWLPFWDGTERSSSSGGPWRGLGSLLAHKLSPKLVLHRCVPVCWVGHLKNKLGFGARFSQVALFGMRGRKQDRVSSSYSGQPRRRGDFLGLSPCTMRPRIPIWKKSSKKRPPTHLQDLGAKVERILLGCAQITYLHSAV